MPHFDSIPGTHFFRTASWHIVATMSLLVLPDDMLKEVLSYFEFDKTTLSKLALQCHRLNALVPAHMFRYLEISSTGQLQLLERSFQENSDLTRHVRACIVLSPDEFGTLGDRVPKALSRFPNLRSFKAQRALQFQDRDARGRIMISRYRYEEPLTRPGIFECDFIEELYHSNITSVHLSTNFNMTEIWQFLLLNGLHTLRATNLHYLTAQPIDFGEPGKMSCVKHLELTGGKFWSSRPDNLGNLLERTPMLQHLKCSLTEGRSRPGVHDIRPLARMIQHLRVSLLARALERVKESLEVLELSSDMQGTGIGRTNASFDLSRMSKLKRIEAPSICFFHIGGPTQDRCRLCEQLPMGLEKLTINFHSDAGIFHHPPNFRSRNTPWADIPPGNIEWLFHWADCLSSRLPNLRLIKLRETNTVLSQDEWLDRDIVAWEVPVPLTEAFERSGAKLEVWLRATVSEE
ncbi:hypothetical protein BU16DRAFT_524972 [Lophium mytilinum]|uniref:F-box domain-containing protein n=1 Tax=Lophium mytilinum TaxID=390894 RepID=A0A6A6R4T4_9PEZI|nr:hypothetical protein BU16DRAFT_524972 [Lophium mytilinum]